MNIEYLHYFLDVADTKSITKAAKRNFISAQGMSRAMGELEKELGCDLLVRYSNRLDLSPLGADLVPKAAHIMESYNELLDYAMSRSYEASEETPSILLECQNIAMLAFLTEEAQSYIFKTPSIHFRESQNSQIRQTLLSNAKNEECDHSIIGLLCFFNQERTSDGADSEELEKLGYSYHPYLLTHDMVMVSKDSPLAKKDILSYKDIVSKPLASSNSHLYNILTRRFGDNTIELSSSNFELRKQLVESDSALSFLPAIAQLTMPDNGNYVLREMERTYEVEIGFLGRESDLVSKDFVELVRILDSFYYKNLDSGLFSLCDSPLREVHA